MYVFYEETFGDTKGCVPPNPCYTLGVIRIPLKILKLLPRNNDTAGTTYDFIFNKIRHSKHEFKNANARLCHIL
jgi:hypothetical protein